MTRIYDKIHIEFIGNDMVVVGDMAAVKSAFVRSAMKGEPDFLVKRAEELVKEHPSASPKAVVEAAYMKHDKAEQYLNNVEVFGRLMRNYGEVVGQRAWLQFAEGVLEGSVPSVFQLHRN